MPSVIRRSRWAQNIGASLILVALVFAQILDAIAPNAWRALAALGFGITLLTFNGRRFVYEPQMPRWMLLALALFAVILFVDLLVGQLYWTSNQTSAVLLLPFVAAFLMHLLTPKALRNVMLFCVVVTLAGALYEFWSNSYLFVMTVVHQGELIDLDEVRMSGLANIFRAKSIFAGPLTLSAFILYSAVILRKSTVAVGLCFLAALASSSRTGMLLTSCVLLLSAFMGRGMLVMVRLALGVAAVGGLAWFVLVDTSGWGARVLATLDFAGEATNQARLMYWNAALDLMGKYSFVELMFGNNGEYTQIMGNSTESGWLFLAVNHGLVTLAAHAMMIFYLMRRMSRLGKAFALILLIGNSVVTMSFGLVGCLLFWMAMLSLAMEGRPRRLAAGPMAHQTRRFPTSVGSLVRTP